MAEPSFERHLQRLYLDTPAFPDAGQFAAGVQRRLDRAWALRRGLIGVAGVAGGVIAAAQFIGSNLAERASLVSTDVSVRLQDATAWVAQHTGWRVDAAHALSVNGEALWLVAGLAALGIGLLAARMFETL